MMSRVPRRKVDLKREDRDQVRAAWAAYRAAQADAERARRRLVTVLGRQKRHYPVAAIARAAGVTPPAVWTKIGKAPRG
jgi:hypothetical protein